jgi:ABC-type lipoprotein export system ATPase subunit
MAGETTVSVVGLGRSYRAARGEVWAFRDIDLEVRSGSLTVLAGPSGSGKSTLLRIIAAIDRPTEGAVTIDGIEIGGMSDSARRRWRRIRLGFVFQDPAENLLHYLTVADHLDLASRLRGSGASWHDLADHLEITPLLDELPERLSSGQQQRVALAMAAVGDPAVVVADEPTAELDQASAWLAIDTLRALSDRGSTVVVSSHDIDVIRSCDVVHRLEHHQDTA